QLMAIDAATRASLELLESQRGGARGSLLAEIDLCVTAAGSRLLARRLAAPLCDAPAINERLDAVGTLRADQILLTTLRTRLKAAPDLSRALTRLALDRGGPRDLRAVAQAVVAADQLGRDLAQLYAAPAELQRLAALLATAPT